MYLENAIAAPNCGKFFSYNKTAIDKQDTTFKQDQYPKKTKDWIFIQAIKFIEN